VNTQELQTQYDTALAKADGIISAAERQKRQLTSFEQQAVDTSLKAANDLKPKIAAAKAKDSPVRTTAELRAELAKVPRTPHLSDSYHRGTKMMPKTLSADYFAGFYKYVPTGIVHASLVEGTNTAGGYAIPIVVDDQIVPLAPQDSTIRRLATVIATKSDIKFGRATTRGAAASKSETASFAVSVQTLDQFELSAFPVGAQTDVSVELATDADFFVTFVLSDMVTAFLEFEEAKFMSGSGSGEPQGLVGNIGTGVTTEPDSSGNLVSAAAIRSLLGTLKETYHENASFVMQRATSLIIRAAQVQSGLFEPVWTRVGKQEYLHGYPVAFSSVAPTAARGNTPVLFGDFKSGYLVGDRGGSALVMKVIDQTQAASGIVTLLGYRRTDARVRRAEAIQSLTIAAS
jgi:HK97 family phage major capsid protein